MQETQNFQNYVRWYPFVHFFLVPIFLFNLIWQAARLYQEPSWDRAEWVLFSFALLLSLPAARLQSLKAQDRIIRLEEKLRYKEILPADLAVRAANFKVGQILALRFASDEELPDLVRKVLNNELESPKEIKQSIKNWRGDYLRV